MRTRCFRRLAWPLAVALLLSPGSLQGQSPSDRRSLEWLSDSLAATADTGSLRTSARALHQLVRRAPADAIARLRLGVFNLRIAELGTERDAIAAVKTLRGVTERQPAWPLAWHALGLAEARRAVWERDNPLELGSRVGQGTLERAAHCQRRALEVDPSYAPAASAFAALTLGLRDTALFRSAARTLRRAAAGPHPDPQVLLAWGRLERAAEQPDSARTAFDHYLAAGGDSALALLELARTRLGAGDTGGAEAYYRGAELDDSAATEGYRADLEPVAADSDLSRFDAAAGRERAEFLRRFWTDRDRNELRAEGERLREHYRRLQFARRNFALTVSRRYYGPADAYRSGGMELDDRGIIYVRHGQPTDRLRPFVFGLMPNESWRFDRAEGDLLFHFSAGYDANGGGDLYDYRLVESVLDLRGAGDAPRDQLLLSRQSFSNLYNRMLNWGRYGAARSSALERGIGQVSIAVGTTTDSHELTFPAPLGAVADLVAVGATPLGTTGHLVFAVAEPGTEPRRDGSGISYPIRVRAVASDRNDRPLAWLDTTIVFRPAAPLDRGQYLIGRAELPLRAGLWSWRAALQLGDGPGVVLPRDTVRAADASDRISLSDLALGIRVASARWQPTPRDTVLLTPFDLFLEGSAMELYYETGGARQGAAYRHEIAVYRLKGRGGKAERRPVVSLGFDEPATDTLLRSHRVLQLSRLKPGRYLLEVVIRGSGSERAARRREFQVVPVRR